MTGPHPFASRTNAAAPVTRLAPSPTGALHLGNARTFLVNWALARRLGWRIVLRIEDLDSPRVKADAASGIADTLRWLGLDWDDGPLVQSADLAPYREALRSLAARGLAYPCDLTRQQIESAASAPNLGEHELRFAADLRPHGFVVGQPCLRDPFDPPDAPPTNWRFATPPAPAGEVQFVDRFSGPHTITPADTIGDFVIWTKRGLPAYQLAVVVDDHRQGITHIVRGDDLLDSAARQLLLYRALGHSPEPTYLHLPLVVGTDGRRLAKRHGDTRVDTYRSRGVPRDAVIGLIAHWCGLTPAPTLMNPDQFMHRLDLTTIARSPTVFAVEHDQWLLSHAR